MTELATTPSRPEQTDHLSKKTSTPLLKSNLRAAKRIYRATPPPQMRQQLKTLTDDFGFSVARGELQIINGSWYATHTGLLGLAAASTVAASTSRRSSRSVIPPLAAMC